MLVHLTRNDHKLNRFKSRRGLLLSRENCLLVNNLFFDIVGIAVLFD